MLSSTVRDAGGGDRVRDIRIVHRHRKHVFTPRMMGASRQGLHIKHRQTDSDLVLEWTRVIVEGSLCFGISPRAFLHYLLTVVTDDSGPSASDPTGGADDPNTRPV